MACEQSGPIVTTAVEALDVKVPARHYKGDLTTAQESDMCSDSFVTAALKSRIAAHAAAFGSSGQGRTCSYFKGYSLNNAGQPCIA